MTAAPPAADHAPAKPETGRPSDVPALLEILARRPERLSLSFYRGKTLEGRLTAGELVRRVETLARALSSEVGLKAGDRVALLTPNRLEVPVVVLALLRLGAVAVPLNPGSDVSDWTYILRHSQSRALFATRELAERVPEAARPPFVLHVEDAFSLDGAAASVLPGAPLGEELGVVLYTSGTTGSPKGVGLRQRGLIENAWSMAKNFRLEEAVQLAALPLYHAHAFGFGLMTSLTTGGHLVFTERLEPLTWAHVVRAESVTVSSVVPTMIPMLLAAGVTAEKVPTLRHLLVSSAPLPVDQAKLFGQRARIPIVVGWGLSEYTNFACCMSPWEPAEERERLLFGWDVPSMGPALEGTEVRVVDSTGAPVGEGVRGELVVRGHSTMLGYLADPESTAAAIDRDGWLHTGDEGFFHLRGERPTFFVSGRLKEVIIRDAEKFSPLRLEGRLVEALPELSGKLVVLGFPHREHGEEVGAYVETEALSPELEARLLAAITAMPLPERPKVVLWGPRPIHRTHTGKVQRRKMIPWFDGRAAHRGGTVFDEVESEIP
jgi:long-chain acyl-CoA synthetase